MREYFVSVYNDSKKIYIVLFKEFGWFLWKDLKKVLVPWLWRDLFFK